jgi:hypothetical protein
MAGRPLRDAEFFDTTLAEHPRRYAPSVGKVRTLVTRVAPRLRVLVRRLSALGSPFALGCGIWPQRGAASVIGNSTFCSAEKDAQLVGVSRSLIARVRRHSLSISIRCDAPKLRCSSTQMT